MSERKSPFILVVVGDSTAGKTTLLGNLRRLKSLRSWVSVQDMDQDGCPLPGRENWRKYRVEELLADAVANYKKNKGSVIGGWIWPHEIIASPYFSLDLNLHFLFLKNTEKEYRRRLKARIGTKITRKEYEPLVVNFPQQHQRLENQVRFTARHFVIDSCEHSRAEVTKKTLEIIGKIAK